MLSYNLRAKIAAYKWKIKIIRYYFLKKMVTNFRFRNKRNDIVYVWPPFIKGHNDSELNDLLKSSYYYLSKLKADITYCVESATLTKYTYSIVQEKVIATEEANFNIANNEFNGARYCLLWHIDGVPKPISLFPNLYSIDPKLVSVVANEWLRLTSDLYLSCHVLPNRSVKIPKYPLRSCAVLGGGPSVDHYYDEQNKWDAWIGCNFIVCDPKIRESGKPFAVCIIDPDFFSPLKGIQLFWESAFELLRNTPAIIITDYKYAPFIELSLPEDIKNKCLYVKTLGNDTYKTATNFDLSDLRVTPYGNVLTDIMLPLAASISQKVMIYGCDGRPPGDSNNFPKSSSFQVYDDNQINEVKHNYSESYYKEYMDMNSLYSRYIVNECMRHGVDISIRAASWNIGLQCLPVINPNEGET